MLTSPPVNSASISAIRPPPKLKAMHQKQAPPLTFRTLKASTAIFLHFFINIDDESTSLCSQHGPHQAVTSQVE